MRHGHPPARSEFTAIFPFHLYSVDFQSPTAARVLSLTQRDSLETPLYSVSFPLPKPVWRLTHYRYNLASYRILSHSTHPVKAARSIWPLAPFLFSAYIRQSSIALLRWICRQTLAARPIPTTTPTYVSWLAPLPLITHTVVVYSVRRPLSSHT